MRLYPRLAWTGIRNNRKLYVPYLLSCVGTVMMYFILHSLSISPLLQETRGGGNLGVILSLGKFVVAVFSLLFLFYSNSFLIRKRYKEFGLYSVLGMDKHSIGRVVLWESLTVSVIGLGAGLVFGIAFSKLAELGLLNAIQSEVDYRLYLSWEAVGTTLLLYGIIFALLLVKSLWKVGRARPLELLRSENYGEKPPKANWVFALFGLALLAGAYYLAVTIQSPLKALMTFFVAVIMVIVASYLLFMAGSVTVCRLLQKNKKYYYRKNHFVSVSSMAYRMKRNGAGLASICILSTMVLVMLSSSASLYFGMNEALEARFPQENVIGLYLPTLDCMTDDSLSQVRDVYEDAFAENQVEPQNLMEYSCATITGALTDGCVDFSRNLDLEVANADAFCTVTFIAAKDYNRLMNGSVSLAPGQALAYAGAYVPQEKTLKLGEVSLDITGTVGTFPSGTSAMVSAVQSCMLVVSDLNELKPLEAVKNEFGGPALTAQYYYGYDLDADDDTSIEVINTQTDYLNRISFLKDGYGYSGGCLAREKYDFLSTYGGLFFIGICLSVMFLFAAAMMIYYKQITEGYEDQSRFDIMQKVGMTKRDIKKSINSQVLTVFFAPLLMAGIHLAFAVPLVWRILQLFGLQSLSFMLLVTAIAFAVFGSFYLIIYKLTAKAYYSIVSSKQ